jgi:hypothetical protein
MYVKNAIALLMYIVNRGGCMGCREMDVWKNDLTKVDGLWYNLNIMILGKSLIWVLFIILVGKGTGLVI